jgi:hypothetical protein
LAERIDAVLQRHPAMIAQKQTAGASQRPPFKKLLV